MAGNAANVFGMIPAIYPDPSPFAFIVTGAAFLWASLRHGLLDIVPVARDTVVEGMREGMVVLDGRNRVVDLNPAAQSFFDRPASEVIGGDVARTAPGLATLLERHRDAEGGQEQLAVSGSSPRDYELTISSLRQRSGEITGRLILLRDITERKRFEDALKESEERYRSVIDNVEEVVFQTDAKGRWTFLNFAWEEVTGFSVKESLGEDFLDYVHPEDRGRNLEEFLRLIEREKDYCRHEVRYLTKGGDARWIEVYARLTLGPVETVLGTSGTLSDVTDRKLAEDALKESERRFRQLFQEVFVTPSIGIALGGPGQDPSGDLVRNADVAMYRAKEEGKARHQVFDPGMEDRIKERLGLENDLRRALERDEFGVHYQPVVALDTGRIIGMEALVRWQHPERGLVPPDEFVPLAEEIGLIVPIDRLVLREACRQAREWQALCPSDGHAPPLLVGVNLSARQLEHGGLVEDVGDALRESGLDPKRLTLEITESAVVGEGERHIAALRDIRSLRVRFALDDFGVGYSSLACLKRLPVGTLKIDRSFVERIGEDAEDEVLVSGMVQVTRGLSMRVLAEGVERPDQLARVKDLGCDLAQGYYFSKPLPAREAEGLLTNRNA